MHYLDVFLSNHRECIYIQIQLLEVKFSLANNNFTRLVTEISGTSQHNIPLSLSIQKSRYSL